MNQRDINSGEIWWAYEGTKIRPVLIVSDELAILDIDINIARLTSQEPRNKFDIEVKHWEYAGLDVPSYIRCSKLTVIQYMKLKRKIGELHPEDLENISNAIEEFYVNSLRKKLSK